jgi:FkbM family methyltransferase
MLKAGGRMVLGSHSVDESHIVYRFLNETRQGTMLDVGAAFGLSLAPFAEAGWDIHAFEPDPKNRAVLEADYGDRRNVAIVPQAVSDVEDHQRLFVSSESPGISSLAPFTKGHEPSDPVSVTTLAAYLDERGITHIDFLKVDVEGFEMNVLRGLDWAVRPRTLVLEFDDAKTEPLGYSWSDLAVELVDHDYQVLISEWFPVTRYGTAHTWRGFKPFPAELTDPRSWGNLIATDSRFDDLLRLASHVDRKYRARDFVERLRTGSVRRS